MKIKIIKLFSFVILSVFLVSCSLLKHSNQTDQHISSNKLTVTNIHNCIVLGKSTSEDLINWFGEPNKKIEDSSKAVSLYKNDNGDSNEGGTMDLLDEYTNYFITEKYVKVSYSGGAQYDSCYEYNSDSLGVEYVRFYIKDGLVANYFYGNITNKSVAKKDKYLRQIID